MNKEEILKIIDMTSALDNTPTVVLDRMRSKYREDIYLLWSHRHEKFYIGEDNLARDRELFLDLREAMTLEKEALIDKWLDLKSNQPTISSRATKMVSVYVNLPKSMSNLYPLLVGEVRSDDEFIGFELEVTTYTPFHWKDGEVSRGWKQHREYRFQKEVNVSSKHNPRITVLEGIVNDHMGY